MFFIFYVYSRFTSPGEEIFFSNALYSLATTVMLAFLFSLGLFFISMYKYYFSKSSMEKNPEYLLYHLQFPISLPKYKIVFVISTLLYFIFFGFLSNIFIYFINETTVFSFFPTNTSNHSGGDTNGGNNNHEHIVITNQSISTSIQNDIKYPNYKLIICCNYMGYVPMLIIQLYENLSILIIPLNLVIGVILSILVGLNVTLNIFTLFKIRSLKLTKRNLLGVMGISTGLFVGCPTCTGTLFYSLIGFSSLTLFASLNIYQALFIVISIPLLLGSIIFMLKILRDNYLNSCRIN